MPYSIKYKCTSCDKVQYRQHKSIPEGTISDAEKGGQLYKLYVCTECSESIGGRKNIPSIPIEIRGRKETVDQERAQQEKKDRSKAVVTSSIDFHVIEKNREKEEVIEVEKREEKIIKVDDSIAVEPLVGKKETIQFQKNGDLDMSFEVKPFEGIKFGIVGIGVRLRLSNNSKRCSFAKIVIGCVSGGPLCASDAEQVLMKNELNNEIIKEAGQVILINCEDILVKNQNISDVPIGIFLWKSKNCNISSNKIRLCEMGILSLIHI